MMKDRIAKSIFWMVWSRGVVQTISFLTTVIVARWLDPSDYGLMALAGTFISVLSLVCELGLGAAIVQFPDLEHRELNLCYYLALGTAVIVYAALFFAAAPIATWFASPRLVEVLRVASLVLPISAIGIVPYGMIQKSLKIDRVVKAEMAGSVVSLVTVFMLAWHGAGVWALIFASLARTLVWVIALYAFSPWHPGIRVGSKRMRQILGFSFGTFGSRALWSIYDQSDNFVLGKIAGESALGFYRVARDIANIPVTRLSTAVNQISVPVLASLQDDPGAMRAMLMRGMRLTATISIPACAGLALVARDLVFVALTPKWLPIVPVLELLCGLAMVKSLDVLVAPVLRARYRTTFLAVYNLVLLVMMPVAFLAGARLGGSVGVACAWLAVYPIIMCRMAKVALDEISLPWREVVTQLRGPFVAAAAMALAVLAVQFAIRGDGIPLSVARLVGGVVIGAIVYTSVLWLRGGQLRDELLEVLSWVFKPGRRAP
jgi:O-antigen/teichoic acid export membrane protein